MRYAAVMRLRVLLPFIPLACSAAALPPTPAVRIAAVSYRLQTRAAALCEDLSPMASFYIKDADSIVVDAVVPDGPAARAGLRAGDRLQTINGAPAPAIGVSDLIDKALDSGQIDIVVADHRQIRIGVDRGCGYPVTLDKGRALDAFADGKAVALTAALVAFTRDDDELALVIGHELAHNILHHKALLDAAHARRGLFASFGKSADAVRKTERAADIFALYMMARAGYDIDKAPVFWARFGAKTGAGVFSDATHLRTGARVTLATTVISDIHTQQARGLTPTPPDKLDN
jgi:Zn-dependent protease with chaperone function